MRIPDEIVVTEDAIWERTAEKAELHPAFGAALIGAEIRGLLIGLVCGIVLAGSIFIILSEMRK